MSESEDRAAEVLVLDVGHGNATLLRDGAYVVLVDAPLRANLLDALGELGISHIDLILVSHADADHLGGVTSLLTSTEFSVGEVRVNPDATRRSDFFLDFRYGARDAAARNGTKLRIELTTALGSTLSFGNIGVEVLHPPPELVVSGSGGRDLEGRPLSGHNLSAVLRIALGHQPVLLLPGDLDNDGLSYLIAQGLDMRALSVVFPHHGGRAGSASPRDFARRLCEAIGPSIVQFSIGRRARFDNPRPEIVLGVRDAAPRAHIACTQLSRQCAANLTGHSASYLKRYPAAGRATEECCAGTMVFTAEPTSSIAFDPGGAHLDFVRTQVPTPLCEGSKGAFTEGAAGPAKP